MLYLNRNYVLPIRILCAFFFSITTCLILNLPIIWSVVGASSITFNCLYLEQFFSNFIFFISSRIIGIVFGVWINYFLQFFKSAALNNLVITLMASLNIYYLLANDWLDAVVSTVFFSVCFPSTSNESLVHIVAIRTVSIIIGCTFAILAQIIIKEKDLQIAITNYVKYLYESIIDLIVQTEQIDNVTTKQNDIVDLEAVLSRTENLIYVVKTEISEDKYTALLSFINNISSLLSFYRNISEFLYVYQATADTINFYQNKIDIYKSLINQSFSILKIKTND